MNDSYKAYVSVIGRVACCWCRRPVPGRSVSMRDVQPQPYPCDTKKPVVKNTASRVFPNKLDRRSLSHVVRLLSTPCNAGSVGLRLE